MNSNTYKSQVWHTSDTCARDKRKRAALLKEKPVPLLISGYQFRMWAQGYFLSPFRRSWEFLFLCEISRILNTGKFNSIKRNTVLAKLNMPVYYQFLNSEEFKKTSVDLNK